MRLPNCRAHWGILVYLEVWLVECNGCHVTSKLACAIPT